MAEFGQVIQDLGTGTGSALSVLIWVVVIGLIIVLALGIVFFFWWNKKKWNLRAEIKLIRSDGRVTIGEWGKAYFNSRKGVIILKRPKNPRKYPMKVLDIKEYLQGSDLITVEQVGPEDFRPIRAVSFTEHVIGTDPTTGELIKDSVMNIKTDSGEYKAWRDSWDSAAKNAYTIRNWLMQHQMAISIGIVILACFIGFAVLWTKLSSVCAA